MTFETIIIMFERFVAGVPLVDSFLLFSIFFSYYLGWLQIFYFFQSFSLFGKKESKSGISSFQILATSLAREYWSRNYRWGCHSCL